MEPDEQYESKMAEAENINLESKIKKLSEKDRERIFEDGKMLASVQKAAEDINCLPCLKIEDIKMPERQKLLFEKVDGVNTQICKTDTNGIVYFRGILDASILSDDERKLLPLFTEVVNQFGTKNYNYREFDNLVSSKTAGLSFAVHLAENVNNSNQYEIGIQFGTFALKENSQDMFNIFTDLLTNVEFKNLVRFEMLLENYLSSLSVGIAQSGHLYAIQNASGLITEVSKLREEMNGLEQLHYMRKLIETKRVEEILDDIENIAKKLLSKRPVRCALNVSDSDADVSIKQMGNFFNALKPDKTDIHWNKSSLLTSSSRHNVMNIPVNYCSKAINAVPYSHDDYPKLRVLARILSSKFLLPVIREQNGAYGAGAKIGLDGIFSHFSYRDPNSTKTLDTFDESSKWVSSNIGQIINDQALFEAKLGVLQQLDAPVAASDKGLENFKFNVTHDMFIKHRSSILNTSINDIKHVAEKYLSDDSKTVVGRSVIGPKNEDLASRKFITVDQD